MDLLSLDKHLGKATITNSQIVNSGTDPLPVLVEMVVGHHLDVTMPSGVVQIVEYDADGRVGLEGPRCAALRPVRQGEHGVVVVRAVDDDVGTFGCFVVANVAVSARQHDRHPAGW